jgi:cytochrome c oxidase subunit 2
MRVQVSLRGAVIALVMGLSSVATQADADTTRGRQVYQLCAACHGSVGEGSRRYGAPAIGGLEPWYVEAQLAKFKDGTRGFRPEDAAGLQMRPMARALVTEVDVRAVAAYVATLRPDAPAPTLTGDAARGRVAYAACTGCHGDRGQGQQAVGAPRLTRQADWYLAAQLEKFRQGLRGTHPNDAAGTQMRAMAMTLADAQAVLDVVAYIRSLPIEPLPPGGAR